jgi:hypothetical protein
MSAIELGLPLCGESVTRLLTDRLYFESLLPMPISDPRWKPGRMTGTERLLQWWTSCTEEERTLNASYILQVFADIPPDTFKWMSFIDWPAIVVENAPD